MSMTETRDPNLIFAGRVDLHRFHVRRTPEKGADWGEIAVFDLQDQKDPIGTRQIRIPFQLLEAPSREAWMNKNVRSRYIRAVAEVKKHGMRVLDNHCGNL